ncbi:MAG: zinc-binding alcohol dehydrogenase [Cyclobacteriaceae bacterium]
MNVIELWHNKKKSWLVESDSVLKEPGNLVIESLYSFVSQGTECLVISESLSPILSSKMRVPFMKGDFHSDFTYGYSTVGHVLEGPEHLKNKNVHLMHPHQNLLIAQAEDVFVLPEMMDPKLGTLASNMETAVNAIWDAQIEVGDKVLIVGYGTIGALTALLAKNIIGTEVFVLDKNEKRIDSAVRHGIKVYEEGCDDFFDIVFNTSANQEIIQKAFEVTRSEGKIVELSWFGDKSISIKLGADFHYGRKQLICSQVSQIPYRKQPIWDFKKRKELVFKLLESLNPQYIIESEIPFLKTPSFYDRMRNGEVTDLGIVVKY